MWARVVLLPLGELGKLGSDPCSHGWGESLPFPGDCCEGMRAAAFTLTL